MLSVSLFISHLRPTLHRLHTDIENVTWIQFAFLEYELK